MEFREGQRVGKYEIVRLLGRGGMGVVYAANDTVLERPVVLKFLAPEFSSDKTFRERILREARAAARVEHPNICTIYEAANTPEGHTYISMAYYEGSTLADRLKRGRLGLEEAVEIISGVLAGLEKAHAGGFIHRDIKPANIMLPIEGPVKILDFGLAKPLPRPDSEGEADLTQHGVIVGTPGYMPPEQILQAPPDERSDLFSLVAVLYEVVTGRRPFPGKNREEIFEAILSKEPPRPPSRIHPGLPRRFDDLIAKGLAKDKKARYQSVAALRSELEGLPDEDLPETERTEVANPLPEATPQTVEPAAPEPEEAEESAEPAPQENGAVAVDQTGVDESVDTNGGRRRWPLYGLGGVAVIAALVLGVWLIFFRGSELDRPLAQATPDVPEVTAAFLEQILLDPVTRPGEGLGIELLVGSDLERGAGAVPSLQIGDHAPLFVESEASGHLLVLNISNDAEMQILSPLALHDDLVTAGRSELEPVVAAPPLGLGTIVAIVSPQPWAPLLRELGVVEIGAGELDYFALEADEAVAGARRIARFMSELDEAGLAGASLDYRVVE